MAWERQTLVFCRVWALSCDSAWFVAANLLAKCILHKVQVNLGFNDDVAFLANNWHSCWTDSGELSVKRRNCHGCCLTSKPTFCLVGTEKIKSYGWISLFKYMRYIKLVDKKMWPSSHWKRANLTSRFCCSVVSWVMLGIRIYLLNHLNRVILSHAMIYSCCYLNERFAFA